MCYNIIFLGLQFGLHLSIPENKLKEKLEYNVGGFGLTEIIILFLIILILFGAKKIPDLFRAVGSSIRSFKKGIEADESDDAENKS